MNKPFTYMSPSEKLENLKNNNFKTNITKVISIFFIISFCWFGYSIYKLITELI